MAEGNIQIKIGKTFDTGLKFIDGNGVPRIIYRTFIDFGALPITTTKAVAHGIATPALDPAYAKLELISDDGTTSKRLTNGTVDATNVSITTAADESAFVNTIAVLDYITALA
jgi:hypothetical protein